MVKVTQEDREAAASGYYAWCSRNPAIPDRMKAGRADNHSMVQAFARHRIAARNAALDEAAKAVELALGAIAAANRGSSSDWMGGLQAALKVATAIRNLKGPSNA